MKPPAYIRYLAPGARPEPGPRWNGRSWKTLEAILAGLVLLGALASCATTTTIDSTKIRPHYYDTDVPTVFEKTIETLHALKWKIESTDPQRGVVVAKTPLTMRTRGDEVTVVVHQLGDGRVRVDITSKSYQWIDWGKTKDDVLKFYRHLDQLMEGESRNN